MAHIRTLLSSIRHDETDPTNNVDVPIYEFAVNSLSHTAVTWEKVKNETSSDEEMHQLLQLVEQDILPEKSSELPEKLKSFHPFREDLIALDGVLLYKGRVIVPPKLRQAVLSTLHAAHQGVGGMLSRADSSVFWPGITLAIKEMRRSCNPCDKMAPSQASMPPAPPTVPEYPFQLVCADYFHYMGSHYLITVDRYTNWPRVEQGADGCQGLVDSLRRGFMTFGIAEEISSDGGPEFVASKTEKFLEDWGVHHRVSSVGFPHSNCRAEVGVKTVKRLITGNTGPSGSLDVDKFAMAMLQYRNTPDPETKISPAEALFGRPIRDFIPVMPGKYKPHPTWQETLSAREEALRNRHMMAAERWSEHTRQLPQLKVGDTVRIQNQTGNYPRRWDKTGRIVEVRQHDQYMVRVDGSGRATLRNRRFLRQYTPYVPRNFRRIQQYEPAINLNLQQYFDAEQHESSKGDPCNIPLLSSENEVVETEPDPAPLPAPTPAPSSDISPAATTAPLLASPAAPPATSPEQASSRGRGRPKKKKNFFRGTPYHPAAIPQQNETSVEVPPVAVPQEAEQVHAPALRRSARERRPTEHLINEWTK